MISVWIFLIISQQSILISADTTKNISIIIKKDLLPTCFGNDSKIYKYIEKHKETKPENFIMFEISPNVGFLCARPFKGDCSNTDMKNIVSVAGCMDCKCPGHSSRNGVDVIIIIIHVIIVILAVMGAGAVIMYRRRQTKITDSNPDYGQYTDTGMYVDTQLEDTNPYYQPGVYEEGTSALSDRNSVYYIE